MHNFLCIITSPSLDGVNITKTKDWFHARPRYQKLYGDDVMIFAFKCKDRHKDEKKLHAFFQEHKKSGNLFDKECLKTYLLYCKKKYEFIFAFEHSEGFMDIDFF